MMILYTTGGLSNRADSRILLLPLKSHGIMGITHLTGMML